MLTLHDDHHILKTYQRSPLIIDHAQGSYLVDVEGRRYLDMASGIAVNALGYGNADIIEAVTAQMNRYMHVSNMFVSPSVVSLAQALKANSFASKVFFSNSGTEANEAALKLCRKWGKEHPRKKHQVVALRDSFHGRSYGGMSLTGKESYRKPFEPMLEGISHIAPNDIKALKNAVSDETCAIFLEMVQGEGGVLPLTQAFVEEVAKLSQAHDILVVVDEIQTGIGRTGTFFAFEQYPVLPDIITTAKALGGGLPLGAMLVNDKLEGVLKRGDHGSTFGGNPVACAAGKALVDVVSEPIFLKNVQEKGRYLEEGLVQLQKKYPNIVLSVRGLGLMLGIDVGPHAEAVKAHAFHAGVILNVTSQTVIRLLPPLNIGYVEIDAFVLVLEDAIKAVTQS